MFKRKKSLCKKIIIVLFIAAFIIYWLFFAYIPKFGAGEMESYAISEEQAVKECPEVVITDYDRDFICKIINSTDIQYTPDGYTELKLTSSDKGYEQYSSLPDVSYIVRLGKSMNSSSPPSVSVQFDYTGTIYSRDLYISVKEDGSEPYICKCIGIKRFDGKLIESYWNFNGKYKKYVFKYGIINYIKIFIRGIMSV
ncbi:MAG: hypothetical protein ACI4JF_02040 [Oscillospiraceae bacterium]